MKEFRKLSGNRRGFTLIEMMVSVTILLLVFAAAVPFFRVQSRAVASQAGRNDAQQNARFAMSAVDRDLRVAGSGIVVQQPMIVQADEFAITFNSDLVTADTADPGAVYYDPDADPLGTTALPQSRGITLPLSTMPYPSMTYVQSGSGGGASLPSRAETVSYWLAPDSSTSETDDYVMFRRVNDLAPTVVTRGQLVQPGQAVFTYFKADSLGALVQIPAARLPLMHTAMVHGSNEDTARSALTDSIRAVQVHLASVYRDVRGDSALRTVEGMVRLLNAGLTRFSSCGEPPLGSALLASAVASAPTYVHLSWLPSTDEVGGERDVERYALFRRPVGTTDWGEPFASVPGGLPSYSYDDLAVNTGEAWEYALIAQDCTPSSSSVSTVGPILIP